MVHRHGLQVTPDVPKILHFAQGMAHIQHLGESRGWALGNVLLLSFPRLQYLLPGTICPHPIDHCDLSESFFVCMSHENGVQVQHHSRFYINSFGT